MQFKLTSRFLLSVLAIVGLVIVTNSILLFIFVIQQQQNSLNDLNTNAVEHFTREFQHSVTVEHNNITVEQQALDQLDTFQAWLQILDFNGNVVYSYNVPDDVKAHYRPVDLIQSYRYQEQANTTVFIGDGDTHNYLIGVNSPNLNRVTFVYENSTLLAILQKLFVVIAIIDIIIVIIVGWIFSLPLTKPVAKIIDKIQRLKTNNYDAQAKNRGIYTPVFNNLHDVAHNLAQAKQERIKLEAMREEWISNVTHDLKTPLASIRGYAELLDDEQIHSAERLEYAKTIEKQADHMKNLLNDLNLTMRLRNQQLPMHKEAINFISFVREIVIDLLNDPILGQHNIQFDAPNIQLLKNIDPHYMRRALLNFIYNAIAHNDGNVEIIIRFTEHGVLHITDNGKGIAAPDLAHIFDRYYRGTNTSQTDGTGLGMAIARDIIVAHDGHITIESIEHQGTDIIIQL